jgi:hypothetical protein
MVAETGTVEDPGDPAPKAGWYLGAAATLTQSMLGIRASRRPWGRSGGGRGRNASIASEVPSPGWHGAPRRAGAFEFDRSGGMGAG